MQYMKKERIFQTKSQNILQIPGSKQKKGLEHTNMFHIILCIVNFEIQFSSIEQPPLTAGVSALNFWQVKGRNTCYEEGFFSGDSLLFGSPVSFFILSTCWLAQDEKHKKQLS